MWLSSKTVPTITAIIVFRSDCQACDCPARLTVLEVGGPLAASLVHS
jgi:hypothetical protein